MEMFLLGYVSACVTLVIGSGLGWFAHKHLVHQPRMAQAARDHSNEVSELKRTIGEMNQHSAEIAHIERGRIGS